MEKKREDELMFYMINEAVSRFIKDFDTKYEGLLYCTYKDKDKEKDQRVEYIYKVIRKLSNAEMGKKFLKLSEKKNGHLQSK